MKKIKVTVGLLFLLVLAAYVRFLYTDHASAKKEGPAITFETDLITVSVKDDDSVLMQGVQAKDAQDGDVSDSLIIEEKTRFISENTRLVSYVAFDQDHNASRATRKMVYADYQLPKINLTGPLIFASTVSNFDPNSRIQASSVLDGDLSSKVRIQNDNDYVVGNNTVEVIVTDSAGGSRSLSLNCTINEAYESDILDLVLKQYLLHAKPGDVINPYQYIDTVLLRGQAHPELIYYVTYSQVKLDEPGIYEINYDLLYDDHEAFSRLVVVVED